MTVKKTVFSALLAVMSLTLYIVEGMIPPVVAIPGFRIGLAYFPVLFSLYLGGRWKAYDTALILIARILLSALVSGNITALLFSMAIILVAGNSANMPELFSSVKFLTTGIVAEFPYSSGLHREALFAIGLVLFVFIMIINLILNGILKKGGKKEKAAKTAGKA